MEVTFLGTNGWFDLDHVVGLHKLSKTRSFRRLFIHGPAGTVQPRTGGPYRRGGWSQATRPDPLRRQPYRTLADRDGMVLAL